MSVLRGDCVEVMAGMEPDSVDAIVTDPPYGLEFMGKEWDRLDGGASKPGIGKRHTEWVSLGDDFAGYNPTCATCGGRARGARKCACPSPDWHIKGAAVSVRSRVQSVPEYDFHSKWATAALRVAKPGAYLLAFGGTRTVHRMTCALEDAGWVIRDMLVWAYAQGFPKSRASLKPAWEPIVLARKPGASRDLNIDACRLPTTENLNGGAYVGSGERHDGTDAWRFRNGGRSALPGDSRTDAGQGMYAPGSTTGREYVQPEGRWPANVILTATEWYTLRHDVSQSVADTIRAFFTSQGVGDLDVPGLREGVRGHARVGSRRASEVLLAPVQLEGVAGGEAGGSGPVAGGPQADQRGPDGQGQGAEVARMEGRALPRPARVRGGERLDPDRGGAGDGAADADEGHAVRPGAPAGGGDEDRAPAAAARGGASPQRGEGRQPAGEPVRQGPGGPFAGTSAHRPRTGAPAGAGRGAGSGERRLTVPLDLIPDGWRHLFEFSHDTGILDGGWEGVVGGGETGPSVGGSRGAGMGASYRMGAQDVKPGWGDSGTYSRFFLIPKAPTRERVLSDGRRSPHPTQKPEALIRHLVTLVTPPGGLVLDPFLGSGTLGVVCEGLGVKWVGIEREAEYADWAEDRIADGRPLWMESA